MRKSIVVVLVIAVVLGLGVGTYYYKFKAAKLSIEDVLPEGAMFYLRISDIGKRLTEFKSTPLWKNIQNIDQELVLEKSGLNQEQLEQYKAFKTNFLRSKAGLFLDKFFGQEIALAIYPSKINKIDQQAALRLASGISLVTRISPEAEFIEFVSKFFNNFGQKVKTRQEKYKGHQITIVEAPNNLNISYVRIKDLVVISLSQAQVQAALDVFLGEKAALAKNKDYSLTMSKLTLPAQTLGYANVGLFLYGLRELINQAPENDQLQAEKKRQILKSFDRLAGLKTAGFASTLGKLTRSKTVLFFDKDKMEPTLAKGYSFQPEKNNTINFVPKDIIYYQWSNCYDVKSNWENFKQGLAKMPKDAQDGPRPEDIFSAFEEKLGMSIEKELIPAIGNELGGFLTDIDFNSPLPIPKVILFVKTKNRPTVEKALTALASGNNLSMQSEECRGVLIKYINLPLGKNLQPAYCFLNDYLLVSSGRGGLKEAIETFNGKSMSLLSNDVFKSINFGLTSKNNSVIFLKTDQLLNKVQEICEWAVNWVSIMAANLQSYQQKAEEYLANFRAEIKAKEDKLQLLINNAQALKKEIQDLKVQGQDMSLKEKELTDIEADIQAEQPQIAQDKAALVEKEQELAHMIANSPTKRINLDLTRLYLDEVIYPVLTALQTHKGTAVRIIFKKNMAESESFSKTE